MTRRSWAVGAACVSAAVLVSGCGFSGIYDTPLPGGADLGDNPKTLHVSMSNVYDLVPQAAVKVNDVPVGRVSAIDVGTDASGTWFADVTVTVNGNTKLPRDTTASLKQTSLLGEKYLDLNTRGAVRPGEAARLPELPTGATIREADTKQHVEAEELFGALSLLLNKGGLEQVRTISRELAKATSGNEPELRALLANANTLATNLDNNSGDITRALDGLDRLSATLDGQKERLAGVVDNIGPGLETLRDQRTDLVRMLRALDELSGVATDVVNRSKDDLVADLKLLAPTVRKLADAGKDLPDSLELLASFPFTDSAVAGVQGDYLNLYIDLDLDLQEILNNLTRSRQLFPGPTSLPEPLRGLLGQQDGAPADGAGEPPPRRGAAPPAQRGTEVAPEPEEPGLSSLLGSLLGGGA